MVFLEAFTAWTGRRTDIVRKIQTKAHGDGHKENRWNVRLCDRGGECEGTEISFRNNSRN
jgi:hypothetical protein